MQGRGLKQKHILTPDSLPGPVLRPPPTTPALTAATLLPGEHVSIPRPLETGAPTEGDRGVGCPDTFCAGSQACGDSLGTLPSPLCGQKRRLSPDPCLAHCPAQRGSINVCRKELNSGPTKVQAAWRGLYRLLPPLRAALVPGVAGLSSPQKSLLGQEKAREDRGWAGIVGLCSLSLQRGHLERIPSSPAVLHSQWLNTSTHLPPHQAPGQPCPSS